MVAGKMRSMVRRRAMRRRRLARLPYRRRLPLAPRLRRANDIASASESIVFTAISGVAPPSSTFITGVKGTTFPSYHNTDINLGTFTRAPSIAQNYQFFKIKYFELTIVPDFDTFIPGGPGAQGRPYLYYMIDKGNNINLAATNQQLKSMGAKPIALDSKSIKIRWAPSVLVPGQVSTATGTISNTKYLTSPWLNTDALVSSGGTWEANPVSHYGIKFFAESVGGAQTFSATLTAHFLFKKPLITNGPGVAEEPTVVS